MTDDERNAVLSRDDARYNALLTGDADTLDAILHDDFVYLHSSGVEEERASFLASIRSRHAVYRRVERGPRSAWVDREFATVRGRVVLDLELAGEPRLLDLAYLSVWQDGDAGWRLREWASVPVRRP